MTKTQRSEPVGRDKKREQMEAQWERQVQAIKEKASRPPAQPKQSVNSPTTAPDPVQIEAITQEAEKALAAKAAPTPAAYSRQDPAPGQGAAGDGLLWWSGGDISSYIPLAEYGTRQRQTNLRSFALVAPMILIAESVLIKKMQALQWSIEAGRNRAIHWQKVLAGLEQDRGWDTFIARWTRAYSESDYGGYAEIIRRAPSWAVRTITSRAGRYEGESVGSELTKRGEEALAQGKDRSWPIVDAKVMDPTCCVPSADPQFPLQYYNAYTGKKHRLRPHQFMHLLDMPNVDDSKPNQGLCAISRAVWAAQEDRMATRYSFEAISANPGTGMILANINQNTLETALQSAQGERDRRGVVYYKGLIFLPLLDPSGNTKLEYLTFSHLPENFNRTEDYSRIKEIVAAAFGMDVLELGSIPGHNLGTSAQAEVGAAKARGKGIGALIQSTEREFRHKFLPPDVQLRIKKHDVEEQKDRAELDAVYFSNATSMIQAGGWDPVLANQYLADMGAIQSEFPYLAADLTESEELGDTEATDKAWGATRVRVDQDGTVHYKAHPYVRYAQKGRIEVKAEAPPRPVETEGELSLRDLIRARELWATHAPGEYGGIVAEEAKAARPRKGLFPRFRDRVVPVPVQSQAPIVNVTMPPAEKPEMVVKMEAPPIHIQADLRMPRETLETETIVDRDVSTGRITATRKQTRRR